MSTQIRGEVSSPVLHGEFTGANVQIVEGLKPLYEATFTVASAIAGTTAKSVATLPDAAAALKAAFAPLASDTNELPLLLVYFDYIQIPEYKASAYVKKAILTPFRYNSTGTLYFQNNATGYGVQSVDSSGSAFRTASVTTYGFKLTTGSTSFAIQANTSSASISIMPGSYRIKIFDLSKIGFGGD